MREATLNYLKQNSEKVYEAIRNAAEASVSIGEYEDQNEKCISVVLTTDFQLETIEHRKTGYLSGDILCVLGTFNSETYVVDIDDVTNFLTDDQLNQFEEMLLVEAKELLGFESDEAFEEYNELSRDEKLFELKQHILENHLVLEYLDKTSPSLCEDYLQSVREYLDINDEIERVMGKMAYEVESQLS